MQSTNRKRFSAIDRYMASCINIDDSAETAALGGDQKVPQHILSVDTEDVFMMLTGAGEPIDPPPQLDFKSMLDLSTNLLAPIPATTCTYVNPLLTDQQIIRDGSPTLLDMDNSMSLYDELAQMKESKSSDYSIVPFLDEDDKQSLGHLEEAQLSFVSESHIKQELVDMQYYNFWESQSEHSDDSFSDSSMDAVMERSIIEDIQQHIHGVSNDLSISQDPENWTSCDVQKWVLHHTQTFYPDTFKQFVQLTGNELCRLTEVDFLYLAPGTGTNLYSQLEIWKNAPRRIEPITRHTLTETQATNGNVDTKHVTHRHTMHLWVFLKKLLEQPDTKCIKWIDRVHGIFKIVDSAQVAKLWGRQKNRPKMDYDKLSRSIRQYYKKGIIKKTEHSKRLVYQFCSGYCDI